MAAEILVLSMDNVEIVQQIIIQQKQLYTVLSYYPTNQHAMVNKIPVDYIWLDPKVLSIGENGQKALDNILMGKEHKCFLVYILFFLDAIE